MNFEHVEDFLSNLFGNNVSQGSIILESQDTQVSLKSRDFDEIGDFLALHGEGATILVRTVTAAGELVAVTSPNTLEPPTGYLVKGVSRVPVWALDVAHKLDSSHDMDDYWLPLAGVDGWSFEVTTGVGYSFEELHTTPSVELDLSVPLIVAVAKAHTSNHWANLELTRGELIEELLNHASGPKEGSCLLQGRIYEEKDTTRKASMMLENHIICLDLDNGLSHNDIDSALSKMGYAYLRYTTHSHNATTTDISKKQYAKFLGDTTEVTKHGLKEFLQFAKCYTAQVSATVSGYDYIAKADNDYYRVHHAPVSKNRIIFFLKKPFALRGENVPPNMVEKWKEKYLGFAESLGISYDRACTDAARLFYFPRHPEGRTDFEAKFFDGKAVDIYSVPNIKPSALRTKERASNKAIGVDVSTPMGSLSAFAGGSEANELASLYRWSAHRAFDIVTAIRDYNPDMILDMKARGGSGAHILCPNEDMHSKTGGTGAYAVDASASDGGKFQLHCTHAHCIDLGKFGLLKLMLDRGDYFDASALTDEAYAPEVWIEGEDKTPKPKDEPAPSTSEPSPPVEEKKLTKEEKKAEKEKQKERDREDNKSVIPVIFEQMNAEYASVIVNKHLYFIKTVKESVHEAGYILMTRDAFNLDAGCRYKMKLEGEMKSAVNEWIAWEGHRQYKEMRFDPTLSVDASVFNTFRGFKAVKGRKGDWSKFQKHLKIALCKGNEGHYNILMTWIAHMIQRPWEKPGFAVIISGGKGVGKSLIADMLSRVVAPYSHTIVQGEQITGKFNSHFDTNIFTVAEEAFFAGDTTADSAIKHLITNVDTISEGKGENVRVKKNYSRMMFLSNEGWVVKADSGHERRYFCFDIPHTFLQTIDENYFKDIFDEMLLNGGLQAFMYELMNWVPPFEESWEILRQAPVTDELRRQQFNSMAPWDRFFFEFLSDGYLPSDGNLESVLLHDDRKSRVDYSTVFGHFGKIVGKTKSGKFKTRGDFDDMCSKYLKTHKIIDNMGTLTLEVAPLEELRSFYNRTHQSPLRGKDTTYDAKRVPRLVAKDGNSA